MLGEHFGASVGGAGDVDGDGYADLLIGSPGYSGGQTEEGRAQLFAGGPGGVASTPLWQQQSNQAYAHYGSTPDWTATVVEASSNFASSVAGAGDVNGDGYADALIGARSYDPTAANEGSAMLFYGNARAGLSLDPQQRQADDSVPIGVEGLSHSSDGFRLRALGRTPFGRTLVKGEWEVERLGVPFDGTGTELTATWRDTGTTGWLLEQAISGLDPDAYHWRLRLRYHPAATPYSRSSRWLTVPWGGWSQTDLRTAAFIGGKDWNDENGDGIWQEGEPPLGGLTVELLDARGTRIGVTTTDEAGEYHFEIDPGRTHRVRFHLREGFEFTAQDQGHDDSLDSDADPVTGETSDISPPITAFDASGWSAGQRTVCAGPGLKVTITRVTKDAAGNPVLTIEDPNQPKDVTGYDIYRDSDASVPRTGWPMVGSNVIDEDPAEPGAQWTDASGDSSPTGVWFYDAAAVDLDCDVEGPR